MVQSIKNCAASVRQLLAARPLGCLPTHNRLPAQFVHKARDDAREHFGADLGVTDNGRIAGHAELPILAGGLPVCKT